MLEDQIKANANLFRILGNPLAYRIIAAIGRGRRRPMELARDLSVSAPAIVNQLRIMKLAGIVKYLSSGERHKGRKVTYWLADVEILTICRSMESILGRIWKSATRA